MSVGRAHEEATEIEAAVAQIIAPEGRVITHPDPRNSGSNPGKSLSLKSRRS
jgi:divalent metal cation (Fe/Co/Zn/Cd) transporter